MRLLLAILCAFFNIIDFKDFMTPSILYISYLHLSYTYHTYMHRACLLSGPPNFGLSLHKNRIESMVKSCNMIVCQSE